MWINDDDHYSRKNCPYSSSIEKRINWKSHPFKSIWWIHHHQPLKKRLIIQLHWARKKTKFYMKIYEEYRKMHKTTVFKQINLISNWFFVRTNKNKKSFSQTGFRENFIIYIYDRGKKWLSSFFLENRKKITRIQ